VLISLGIALKRFRLATMEFFQVSDRLLYFIFFPTMLFWKIGSPGSSKALDWRLVLAVLLTILCVSLLSLLYMKLTRAPAYIVGSFSQCCYRFNTYVGLAVVLSVFGEEGVKQFGIILVFSIPFINLVAVSTLIWFSGKSMGGRERLKQMGFSIATNPLILGCLAGFTYSHFGLSFPLFLENTFRLLSAVSLPLALLSIGSALQFSKLKDHFKLAMVSSVAKLLILPAIGFFFLGALRVSGLQFSIAMIFFSLPTATSIYILSSQLNSDTDLASAGIVLSTALSIASLSTTLILFASEAPPF
jgi:predicted permease